MFNTLIRTWRVLLLAALLGGPALARAAIVDAVEYYNAGLDHYFVTALPNEIAALDAGMFVGWQRTGLAFKVAAAGDTLPGSTPVCRFYGRPEAGLDSHFYSASPAECAAVQQNFAAAWQLESTNVFLVYPANAASGACPAGSVPIYRAWNARVDSNHRYTTSLAVQQAMIAKGYIAEGYGSSGMPVAMCSPTGGGGGIVPTCTVAASNTQPVIGQNIVVTASCSGSPTAYTWSGCSSTTSTCTVTSNTTGIVTYSVMAANGNGTSTAVGVDVAWRPNSGNLPPPECTLAATANTDPPQVGNTLLLAATCSNNPRTFTWTGCGSSTSLCYVAESSAGTRTYTLVANNEGGASAPVSITITWVPFQPSAQDFCGAYPAVLRTSAPWSNTQLNSVSYTDPPGFAWDGVWVMRLNVPANATGTQQGRVFVAEYFGPPTYRDVSISKFACDFRAVDPSGNNGTLLRVNGVSAGGSMRLGASAAGVAGLQPGQTYYINVRNRDPAGNVSCSESQQRCDAFINVTIPH